MSGLERDDLVEAFLTASRDSPFRGLLLDYDGTLAPFQADRMRAVPYPGVREALAPLVGRPRHHLAIVSGRPADEVSRLLDLHPRPEIWGSHGFDRLFPDGRRAARPLPEPAGRLLAEISAWARSRGWGEVYEEKPFGIALHARAGPQVYAVARQAMLDRFGAEIEPAGLACLEFDGGLEIRPAGAQKGAAVEEVLAELPAGTALAYLGDDTTDEDAFRTLGNHGLSVLVRPEWRPTAAQAWIRPPRELLELLAAWEVATR